MNPKTPKSEVWLDFYYSLQRISDRNSRSQSISVYNLPSNHHVLLSLYILYNWLQAKKSVGVATSVKVAKANLIVAWPPVKSRPKTLYNQSIPRKWLSLDKLCTNRQGAIENSRQKQDANLTYPSNSSAIATFHLALLLTTCCHLINQSANLDSVIQSGIKKLAKVRFGSYLAVYLSSLYRSKYTQRS